MANAAVRVCGALAATLLLAVGQWPRTSRASSLSVHPSGRGNASCGWRFNLIDDDGNRVERCIDQLSITFPGTPSGGLTTEALADKDSVATPPDGSAKPPSGYKPLHGGHFYKLHSRPARWHAAKEACEREGAHLLVVDTAEEAGVVRALLGLRPYDNATIVHAGFYVALVTVQGEVLQLTWHERWVRGDPNAPACGQMDSDGFLWAASCVEERSFVCEHEPPFTPSTASPPSSSSAPVSSNPSLNALPKGYEAAPGWNNSYYRLGSFNSFHGFKTWNSAKYNCEGEDGYLASFESEEEIQAVVDLLQKEGKKNNGLFYRKIYVGVRTGERTTVLGDLVHESGFNRWKGETGYERRDSWKTGYESDMCFWIDYKLFLHSIGCEESFLIEHFLCERAGPAILVPDGDYY